MKLFITRIVLALRHFQQWLVAQLMFGFLNFLKLFPADGAMRFADWLTRRVGTAHGPANWIRLPLQIPLAWWLWREARRPS